MNVAIAMVSGPISPACHATWWPDGSGRCAIAGGALVSFDGVVRPLEGNQAIDALDYEAYEPMASRQLRQLGERVARDYALLALACWHSIGRVGVGQASLRVQLAGAHRAEVIAALGAFIDALKVDVPIWKSPVWAE